MWKNFLFKKLLVEKKKKNKRERDICTRKILCRNHRLSISKLNYFSDSELPKITKWNICTIIPLSLEEQEE